MLNKDYWQNRYQEEKTGWDAGSITTPIKAYFDAINDKSQTHSQALIEQIAKVGNSELTPSAMMMAAGKNGDEFIDLMLAQAKLHQTYFSERGLSSAIEAQLQRETIESIQQQKLLEANDVITFEQFLAQQNAR